MLLCIMQQLIHCSLLNTCTPAATWCSLKVSKHFSLCNWITNERVQVLHPCHFFILIGFYICMASLGPKECIYGNTIHMCGYDGSGCTLMNITDIWQYCPRQKSSKLWIQILCAVKYGIRKVQETYFRTFRLKFVAKIPTSHLNCNTVIKAQAVFCLG